MERIKVDYELFEQIGRGRKGLVFRGLDVKNKREVAIKKIRISNANTIEINNHLKLNKLDIVPTLYDYFNEDGFTYIVQMLLNGKGLHETWKINKNWDFIWMTVYHAINLIKQFHDFNYIHGDLHLNNFVWTGDKMFLIDFDKMINVPERLLELEKEKINSKDIYEIEEKIYDLKGKFCDDYSYVLSTSQFARLGQYEIFDNINKGYERYTMLIDYYRNNQCGRKFTYKSYSDVISSEYNRIDKLNL